MTRYTFFTIDQFHQVSILTWRDAAATRIWWNGELQNELQAFIAAAKPRCVVVSFAQLQRCQSLVIGGLIGLNRQLKGRGGSLVLCDLSPWLREQFDRLHLHRIFRIESSLSEGIAVCDDAWPDRAQPGRQETTG